MTPSDPMTDLLQVLLSSGSLALISAHVLQAMKKSSYFAFLGTDATKAKANFAMSVLFAAISAFGIHYTYHWDPTAGAFQLVITGLTLVGVAHGIAHWIGQWVAGHISYKMFVVPTELQAANIDELKLLAALLQTLTNTVKQNGKP